ncbi:hypothetical protein [Weissella cibaria]|uniref:hypothetical protein n=2 Tax=Lactobacillaceae TaxID=33958 RepID=UPI001E607B02|nr:hypothetical protein [Weissella cibaria]
MAIENTTYKKKKNKQWLRYGTTSLIVAMGLGAGATGQAMAAEDPTTTDIDPTSTKTGEDDSQNTDSDNRDVDGDGLDDETGQPIPTNTNQYQLIQVIQRWLTIVVRRQAQLKVKRQPPWQKRRLTQLLYLLRRRQRLNRQLTMWLRRQRRQFQRQ